MTDPTRLPDIIDISHGNNQAILTLGLRPDLYWFQGHFPTFPLLPGVVQLDWALFMARQHLGLTLAAATQFQVKYKGAIFPGDRILLTLSHQPDKKRLNFDYRRDDSVCSSGRIALP